MYTKSILIIIMFATLLVVIGFGNTYAYAQLTNGPSPQQQSQSSHYAQQQQSPTNPYGEGDRAGQGEGVANPFFEPGSPDPSPNGVGPVVTPGAESPPSPLSPENSAPGWGSEGISDPYPPGYSDGEKAGWEECDVQNTGRMCPSGQADNFG